MISDIAQWQNPGYALSVCSWLRLDALENPSSPGNNYRRQFFKYILQIIWYIYSWFILWVFFNCSLSSNKGHSFEAFFLSDGTLVVSVTWKKEYTTAMVHSVILNDHQWHSVCISFNPSRWEIFQCWYFHCKKNHIVSIFRRLFGQSHISVFVDGALRLTVNVRIPPVGEVNNLFQSMSF